MLGDGVKIIRNDKGEAIDIEIIPKEEIDDTTELTIITKEILEKGLEEMTSEFKILFEENKQLHEKNPDMIPEIEGFDRFWENIHKLTKMERMMKQLKQEIDEFE